MVWVFLLFAGLLEIVWALGLKYTDGFSRLWPKVGTLFSAGLSFVFFGPGDENLAGRHRLWHLDGHWHCGYGGLWHTDI